ncbi:uncharacterized protein Dana_GF21455, isoform B [Drosophila ananassae]|uniref:Uncharacterized protein, isoform A n=1 Tax=Drosophila ananassae TaxID=7217 RepID=B3MSF0_DROAN|nr:uncharacterized protein LOC6504137 [Drosophila ananassae]XP_014761190.1 uncharacterized protein LOC6504137 [Drosophila ananassae]EDV34705.1 uncharacterized protein Dana_GF21455, isoform A [Drosophila ananassae]KPU75250.1 uncharacterized protein Dana_GF21455, isoform B [Drosophila ananassae]
MERKATKRSRSADDDDANNNVTQSKVWVSQKMSDARDPEKMKEVHEKTTKMLFDGAASSGNGNRSGNGHGHSQQGQSQSQNLTGGGGGVNQNVMVAAVPVPGQGQSSQQQQEEEQQQHPGHDQQSAAATAAAAAALCEQYQLLGDGTILLRDLRPDMANPRLERKKSRCCQRQTLIHGVCVNCTMDLCEECGYSCGECSQFICRSCVTLFGNRPDEADDPLCERCQMFYA